MTTDVRFDRTVAEWLQEDARYRVPDHLAEVLGRTSRARQRPWWSSPERWLPMDLTTRVNALNPPRLGRVILVAALVVALLGLVLFAVGARQRRLPAPFGPAANGSVVYSTAGDISVMAARDGTARVIVGGPSVDVGPLYSYDGTRIAFLRLESGDALRYMVMDAEGGNLKVLTPEPLVSPDQWDWSPDGTSLVVLHTAAGQRVVSIIPTDGSGSIRRLDLDEITPDVPVWSPPDGREIVFRGTTDGGARAALFGVRPDGSGLHPLTSLAGKDDYASPRLSSDGGAVAYWNYERDASSHVMGGRVHVFDLRNGDDRLIGHDPTAPNELDPKFSPDGSQVLFMRYGLSLPAKLMIAPADGNGPARQVGPDLNATGNFFFEFSPDGQQVFVFDRTGGASQRIDVADGSVLSGASIDDWATWQRLAPTD